MDIRHYRTNDWLNEPSTDQSPPSKPMTETTEITVSDRLYRQLEAEAKGGDIEGAMWKMVSAYRRAENPGD